MNKANFKDVSELWDAMDKGTKVYWGDSETYQVIVEADNCPEKKMFGNRGEQCLSIRCMSNWFGCKIQENELSRLYVKG